MDKNLQEIVMICMNCGQTRRTGKYTERHDTDMFAYSHGYCSKACVKAHHGEYIASLLLEAEEWTQNKKQQSGS